MDETSKIKNFTDLVAWQEGQKLVVAIYSITKQFPKEELYCLVSQIRRAAVSIVSNLAEGFGRLSQAEKRQFYNIAAASVIEVQAQLLVARDLQYIREDECADLFEQTVHTHKLINGLIARFA